MTDRQDSTWRPRWFVALTAFTTWLLGVAITVWEIVGDARAGAMLVGVALIASAVAPAAFARWLSR